MQALGKTLMVFQLNSLSTSEELLIKILLEEKKPLVINNFELEYQVLSVIMSFPVYQQSDAKDKRLICSLHRDPQVEAH